jgi:hypothetical protein
VRRARPAADLRRAARAATELTRPRRPSELAGGQCDDAVYQLLHRRPVVLSVLALPVGYLAAFDGDSLETVLDTNDHNLWQLS